MKKKQVSHLGRVRYKLNIINNAAGFLKRLKWFLTGMKRASVSTQVERLNCCMECAFYSERLESCELCGCPVSWKTMIPSESCPDDHWKAVKQ